MASLVTFWLTSFLVLIGENLAIPVEEPHGVDLLSALKRGYPLLSFTTTTSTVTQTEVTTQWLPSVICAKLVNVTGQCRLQPQGNAEDGRIYQMEQPEVLTFDDDMDEADALVQLQPTITLKVEPTDMPDNLESNSNMRLEASWTDPAAHKEGNAESPGKSGLAESIRAFFNVIRIERVTVTETSVTFLPSTTKTIFIMRCTPRPFTASICSRGPRGSRQDLEGDDMK